MRQFLEIPLMMRRVRIEGIVNNNGPTVGLLHTGPKEVH
jgi:hypothetical protein